MHTVAYRLHKVCAQLHFVPVVGTQALVTGQPSVDSSKITFTAKVKCYA